VLSPAAASPLSLFPPLPFHSLSLAGLVFNAARPAAASVACSKHDQCRYSIIGAKMRLFRVVPTARPLHCIATTLSQPPSAMLQLLLAGWTLAANTSSRAPVASVAAAWSTFAVSHSFSELSVRSWTADVRRSNVTKNVSRQQMKKRLRNVAVCTELLVCRRIAAHSCTELHLRLPLTVALTCFCAYPSSSFFA